MNFMQWHNESTPVPKDEIVIFAQHGVSLYEGETRTQWQDGKVTVTSHNIFFRPGDGHMEDVLRLPLEDVLRSGHSISCKAKYGFSHAKVLVPLPGDNVYLKYSFRNGGMEEFYSALCDAVKKAKWQKVSGSSSRSPPLQMEAIQKGTKVHDLPHNDNHLRDRALDRDEMNETVTIELHELDDDFTCSSSNRNNDNKVHPTRLLTQTNDGAVSGVSKLFSIISPQSSQQTTAIDDIDPSDAYISRLSSSCVQSKPKTVVDDSQSSPGNQTLSMISLSKMSAGTQKLNDDDGGGGGGGSALSSLPKFSSTYNSHAKQNCKGGGDDRPPLEHTLDHDGNKTDRTIVLSLSWESAPNLENAGVYSEALQKPKLAGEKSSPLRPSVPACGVARVEYEKVLDSGNTSCANVDLIGDHSKHPSTREASLLSVADRAGIAGLMRASVERAPLDQALRDIDDVMKDVSSLVANIRHLKQKQNGPVSAEDDTAIESIEATLGLGAVVRQSRGTLNSNRFHNDLAQELHSWITHEKNFRIFGSTPLIPLIELFSLYNKARGGSDLVSPGDVLSACRIMEKRPYSVYNLKHLSSGRLALQQKDPLLVLEKLSQLLGPRLCTPKQLEALNISENSQQDKNYTSPSRGSLAVTTFFPQSCTELKSINEIQFAACIQVGRSVALDLLEDFESQGYLCRSSGGFGSVSFHWNVFVF